MCLKTIPVVSQPRSNIARSRQRNPANLRPISTSSTAPPSFSVGLWNYLSAVNKADFILAFSLQSTLSILGLTETWIRQENSATPAALSNNFSFSHTPLRWFESYLTGRSFEVAWGGEVSKTHQPVTVVPQGSVLGPPPLLHIHYITGSHHKITWFLLPLLCWWHTAVSLISTWWSNGSCRDLRLPGGHHCMDEITSPTAQPGKDWASCLPCHSDSTARFHHPARLFYNYPIKLSQKSLCYLWWTADLQRPRCKDNCITQHQEDQALSNGACCTTSCPGPCHF